MTQTKSSLTISVLPAEIGGGTYKNDQEKQEHMFWDIYQHPGHCICTQEMEAAWFDGVVEAASPEPVEELVLPVQSSSHRGGSRGGDIHGVDTANPAHYPNGVTPLIPRGELTKSRFLVTNGRCSARGPDLGWRSVKIVKALTGALISQCQIVEEMTGAELLNCVTTLASRALNVPRLCLLFTWTCSSVPQEVVACATLITSADWLT